jgi:glycosyltransferase involved in cell wall biosynthesis
LRNDPGDGIQHLDQWETLDALLGDCKAKDGFRHLMRVGHVSSFYPELRGGAEVSLAALLPALADIAAADHLVFATRPTGRDGPLQPAVPPWIPARLKLVGHPLLDRMIAARLHRTIGMTPVDVLHVHDTYVFMGAERAARASSVPLVLSYHNNVGVPHAAFGVPAPLDRWFDRRERKLLEILRARHIPVLATSAFVGRQLVRAGLSRQQVQSVFVGGSQDTWGGREPQPEPARLRVVGGGLLQGHKGIDVLLRATRRVKDVGVSLDVTVVGTGRQERELKALARELGLGSSVDFTGHLPHAALIDLLDQADVVVVPSVAPEVLGRMAIEGASRGNAIVASEIGALPEIVIDGVTGYLVRPGDVQQLADRLIDLHANRKLLRTMGERGLEECRSRFAAPVVARHVTEAYRSVALG